MGASVKIMLSHDYCHFEVSKSTDQQVTDAEIDAMRKDVQRLAIRAVEQYKKFKEIEAERINRKYEFERARIEAEKIEQLAEEDRTPRQQALLKAFKDRDWKEYLASRYDFEDEPDDEREYMGMGQEIPGEE